MRTVRSRQSIFLQWEQQIRQLIKRWRVSGKTWLLIAGALLLINIGICSILTLVFGLMYASDSILPGVRVAGIDVGGQSVQEATASIENGWAQQGLILDDDTRQWTVDPSELGIYVDGAATAQAAYEYGRNHGNFLSGLWGTDVAPVVAVDFQQAYNKLSELTGEIDMPAQNAGVALVEGGVVPTQAVNGRILDVDATIYQLQQDAGKVLADGHFELMMVEVAPEILDSSAMVQQATQLLANPLQIKVFDPVQNEGQNWTISPVEWSTWLTAKSDQTKPLGLSLSLDGNGLRAFLQQQRDSLENQGRYIDIDEAVGHLQQAVANQQTNATLRLYHYPGQHTVRPGETLSSIAYDYGIPYPWVQDANPGIVDGLSIGQTITIPSPDDLIPLPIVSNKRIVVNISRQRIWVYENDQVKWEWVVSTGIASSPTWPGVFQIQSHEGTAYAGNWNLWMPSFMGVYRPVPSSEFMNGFHGFPSRNGSQILWTSNLGSPITYGCILLSSDNAELLYSWAEEGVIVEIQP